MRRLLVVALLAAPAAGQSRDCDGYYTPLVVPDGFCTRIFADSVGPVRQVFVHPDGQIVAALNGPPGLIRLRDADHDGRAESRITFGPGQGGTGVTWRGGWLYFAADSGVVRYRWPAEADAPDTVAQWIATDLPVGDYGSAHTMKGIAVGTDGAVYVSIGSQTDNCQVEDRKPRSPGQWPCAELERRAGIWRFQPPAAAGEPWSMRRFSTGLRNDEALAIDPPTGILWGMTQGRDFLNAQWGWDDTTSANQPAELLEQLVDGGDYGWPYCMGYWTRETTRLMPAPEYSGRPESDCATKNQPVMGFPGHWAPMAIAVVNATAATVPHPGLYLAFHGSRSRRPLAETGHFVVFVPFDASGRPVAGYRIMLRSGGAPGSLRPAGVAVAIDGNIYVTDDENGRVIRIEPHPGVRH
ncbi:MAG: PQQ-dependent sugar dehydrogenase [Gemmatimonadales bacterium]